MTAVMESRFQQWKVPSNYDVQKIQEDFLRCKDQHYLDHAAATLYSDSQIKNVSAELLGNLFGNPHSRHTPSDTATQIIDAVRQRILDHFKTTSQDYDVILTSGATDALKIVAQHFDWNSSSDASRNGGKNSINGDEDIQEPGWSHRGAFVYQRENHTSVLGIRDYANHCGADVHSATTERLKKVLSCTEAAASNMKVNGYHSDSNSFSTKRHCLFAYSPHCNFSGAKAPLNWIKKVQNGSLNELLKEHPINRDQEHRKTQGEQGDPKWFVLLDAAGYVATCPLDLSKWKPDFVTLSFYKIFGYPTGLGCLLVSCRALEVLKKTYYGGGTVLMADSRKMTLIPRPVLHNRFEDGTLPYLDIIAVRHGFDVILKHTGGMENIQQHVYNLARYTHHCLRSYRHANGKPVSEFYLQEGSWDIDTHGSIINFNLLKSNGSYVGYAQVERMASVYNIHLRTGCLCNPGACQTYLDISEDRLKQQFQAGHVCGDAHDLIDGLPTGSVRISFGYMSTYEDADQFLRMIANSFVDGSLLVDTSWMSEERVSPTLRTTTERPDRTLSNSRVKATPKSNHGDDDSHKRNGRKMELLLPQNKSNDGEVGNHVQKKNLSSAASSSTTNGSGDQNGTDSQSRNLTDIIPLNNESELTLTDIIVYPVKSCGGMSVQRWRVASEGLQYDRKWMVTSDSGVTMTQKRLPKMCLIQTSIDIENNTLTLSYEGKGELSVPLENAPEPHQVEEDVPLCCGRVCGDRVKGLDCGEEVGEWLSRVLDKPNLKLMRQTNVRRKKRTQGSEGEFTEDLSLANDSQYLLVHLTSVRRLLKDIHDNGAVEMSEVDLVRRFRGNFLIDGGEPYEEDLWRSVRIDNVNLQVRGGCRRCQIINVSETGERTKKEPMLTLESKRGSSMMFGVYAMIDDDRTQEDLNTTVNVGAIVRATT